MSEEIKEGRGSKGVNNLKHFLVKFKCSTTWIQLGSYNRCSKFPPSDSKYSSHRRSFDCWTQLNPKSFLIVENKSCHDIHLRLHSSVISNWTLRKQKVRRESELKTLWTSHSYLRTMIADSCICVHGIQHTLLHNDLLCTTFAFPAIFNDFF